MCFNSLNLNEITSTQAGSVTVLIWLNIVLLSVIFLFLFFRIMLPWFKKLQKQKDEMESVPAKPAEVSGNASDDDKAAIAMALYLYFNEMHDEESNVITIKRVSKTYSPWSSKLYSMRNLKER